MDPKTVGMPDLNALLQQLAQAQSLLEAKAKTPEFQEKMPKIKAQLEANLRKALEIKTEQENYLKRLRGEEVESDREKEGNLDDVAGNFEAEHGLAAKRIEEVVELLRQATLDRQKSSTT